MFCFIYTINIQNCRRIIFCGGTNLKVGRQWLQKSKLIFLILTSFSSIIPYFAFKENSRVVPSHFRYTFLIILRRVEADDSYACVNTVIFLVGDHAPILPYSKRKNVLYCKKNRWQNRTKAMSTGHLLSR